MKTQFDPILSSYAFECLFMSIRAVPPGQGYSLGGIDAGAEQD